MIEKVLNILREKYNGLTMLGSFTDKSPFQILIATALSARSKDVVTIEVVKDLFPRYPDAKSLAKANVQDIEKIVKRTGFYKVKAQRIIDISKYLLTKCNGKVPSTMEQLVEIPGVGRKTAGCVLVYAFNKPAIPVDTHVHRVSNRLGWVKTKLPEETENHLERLVPKDCWMLINEVFVLHGQNICSPITPHCSKCPVFDNCERIGVTKYH